jgi:hypothetical protein
MQPCEPTWTLEEIHMAYKVPLDELLRDVRRGELSSALRNDGTRVSGTFTESEVNRYLAARRWHA